MWLRCLDLFPDVIVNFVSQDNRESFKRNVRGDAFDVVVMQSSPVLAEVVVPAATEIQIPVSPVTGIVAVFLNDSQLTESVDYVFVKDTGLLKDSTRAKDSIRISRAMSVSDVVRIRYNYCEYCTSLQNTVFSGTRGFFGYDALVRLAEPVDLYVTCSVNQYVDLDSVRALISGVLNSGTSGIVVSTQTVYDAVLAAYPNITMDFSVFNKSNTGVKPVSILQHQTPRLTSVHLSVSYK